MVKISIIDIDSMFYQAGTLSSLEECIVKFKEKLNNCLDKTECDYWAGFTSKGKTFRHKLFDGYKLNRTQAPLRYLQALKEWAIAEYNLNVAIGWEADDTVAWLMNRTIYLEKNTQQINFYENLVLDEASDVIELTKVMCAIDKDLLQSIPGKHFNYSYKIKDESKDKPKETLTDSDFNKGWWVETSEDDTLAYELRAMIIGDAGDGCSGLKGKGRAFVDKLFNGKYYKELPAIVLDEYIKEYGISDGIFYFQRNYRTLHILNSQDDFIRELGQIPEFPQIQQVIKPVVDEKIDF